MSDKKKDEAKRGKSKESKKSKKSKKKPDEHEKDNSDNYQAESSSILSTRAYLEQNVTPIIQEAMIECAKKRPSNPIEFIGHYLLDYSKGK